MEATERLASLVVARRVELGYKRRPAFAGAAGISLRTLGDIETGRRANFDPATIAAIEQTLQWATGSFNRVLAGGQPTETGASAATHERAINGTPTPRPERDEAVMKVLTSDLTEEKKEEIIRLLIAEKQAADRARAQRAEDLIRLVGPTDG